MSQFIKWWRHNHLDESRIPMSNCFYNFIKTIQIFDYFYGLAGVNGRTLFHFGTGLMHLGNADHCQGPILQNNSKFLWIATQAKWPELCTYLAQTWTPIFKPRIWPYLFEWGMCE